MYFTINQIVFSFAMLFGIGTMFSSFICKKFLNAEILPLTILTSLIIIFASIFGVIESFIDLQGNALFISITICCINIVFWSLMFSSTLKKMNSNKFKLIDTLDKCD